MNAHAEPGTSHTPHAGRVVYGHWRGLDCDSQAPRYDAICDLINPDASVLDIGCGAAVLLGRLRARGYHGRYLGVEHDAAAVKEGIDRFGPDAIQHLNEHRFLSGQQWDVIVLSEVLYYLPDPVGSLQSYTRLARSGGKMIITIYLRPGRPRLTSLIRSWLDPRFPRDTMHCAQMVGEHLKAFPPCDIKLPGTEQYWRMWHVTLK